MPRPSDMCSQYAVAVPAVSAALSVFSGSLIFSTFGSHSRTFRRAAPLEDVVFMSGERPLIAKNHFERFFFSFGSLIFFNYGESLPHLQEGGASRGCWVHVRGEALGSEFSFHACRRLSSQMTM